MVEHAQARDDIVVAQRLTKVFKDFWMRPRARAVDQVEFAVHRGEIFGLLGPNGSGKSTTIKMILGLLKPTSGRLAVLGRPPSDVLVKKRIGYLPEESYLYPFLNARETLEYYAKLFEIDHRTRKRRVEELLEMVGLQAVAHRTINEYSKGMQRRIGIAQALVNDPDFLILDEPTTGLDPIGTRQVKDLILELGRRGKTVLLSSHLLADVEDVVDRMVVLFGGKIRAEGTCDELLETKTRSTLEIDQLDDETLAEIRAVLERRGRALAGVSHPRQKLEELFISLVETAKRERIETSGATNDGEVAAFLRGDSAEREGGELIEDLVASEDPEAPMPVETSQPARPRPPEPEQGLVEGLVDHGAREDHHPRPDPRPAEQPRQHQAETHADDEDDGDDVIRSLIDPDDDRPGDGSGR